MGGLSSHHFYVQYHKVPKSAMGAELGNRRTLSQISPLEERGKKKMKRALLLLRLEFVRLLGKVLYLARSPSILLFLLIAPPLALMVFRRRFPADCG